jgi:signal transduction histidine kinase
MKLRTKLIICSVIVIAGSVGLMGWGVDRFVRQQFEQEQRQKTDTFVTQFRQEFTHRGDEVAYAVQGIAEAEGTLRMAIDLSRAQADPSLYARDAVGIANSRQLDFLEIVGDDGTLISSAQWPGRIGFKNDWVTQKNDWNQQSAFLARVELPDKVELGLLCVRSVNVGEKKLYLIGGRRLDNDFLHALVIPAGMQMMFYPNLEAAFVPEALFDSQGPAEQPERFASLIGSMQKQPRSGEYEIAGTSGEEKFTALPLTGRNNEMLAVVLVGNAQNPLAKTSAYIRNAGLLVGAAGILLALIFSWSISAGVRRPLERLEKAAREFAAGDWKAKAKGNARGEAGRAVRAFNDMAAQLSAKREGLLQTERVAAWRELARNFAVELKVPLFSMQLTLENLERAREKTPEKFDGIFVESMRMAHAEMENLKQIVTHFNDFAKMRQPRMQAVDMNEIVRAVIKSFEIAFHARGRPPVKPELLLDELVAKVWGDGELLYKGFENVIANSLNAMPMGGTLTVRTTQQNGMVRVEIADSGSGLEDEEPIDAALRYAAKLEGAGLGLATIQSVVSDHGGRMSVEATPGAGTAFRMDFPVAPTSGKAAQPVTPAIVSKPQKEPTPEKTENATTKQKPVLARMMDI